MRETSTEKQVKLHAGKRARQKSPDFDSQEGRFFVRVLKKARADVEKVFGAVVPVVLDSALEEFAFVTESMQEAEFEKCREQIFGFVKKIRIKD